MTPYEQQIADILAKSEDAEALDAMRKVAHVQGVYFLELCNTGVPEPVAAVLASDYVRALMGYRS